jgi:ABC-type lipoprotein export system ATPase subunit
LNMDHPVIELKNACKGWFARNRRIEVFQNIDLQVYPNQSLAIMGPSGSGKSTLLHLLGLLMPLDSGSMLFDGQPVHSNQRTHHWRLRQNIGIIFQDSKLIPNLTVLENVCLPLAHRSIWPLRQRIVAEEILERVGLSERLMHYPSQLSGGEMSRVAFARALAFKPKVLLADEPTGNLDDKTGETISDLLMSVVDGNHALVMVTHQASLANRADRILHIKDGKLVS